MDLDFKLIILFVMLLGIVLFFTRELENLRKDFEDKINTVVSAVDNNSKSIKGKIQADMTTCVTKIKNHNMECIQQIRKMNTLGSQPITNMSNHCTDSDTDVQQTKKYNIKYLSDMRADVEKEKHDPSTYYVSEVSPPVQKQGTKKEEPKQELKEESNNFKIDLKTSVEQKSNLSNGAHKKKMDLIQSDLNKTKTVSQKDVSAKSTPSLISQESDEVKESDEPEESESEPSSENESSSDESDDQTSDNDSNQQSDDEPESDDESVEVEIDRRALGKLSDKKYANKEPELVKEANNNEYESITVGSSKGNKKGVKPMMSVSKGKRVESSDSSEVDEVSVQTHEIGNLTLEKLQEINKYKIDALKKIAKKYSIALTCKEGGGRRQLNKGELYNKIKEFLTDTHNIAS